MKSLTRNQWIAVSVSLVVIGTFLITGQNYLSLFSPQNIAQEEQKVMDTNKDQSASDTPFATSLTGFEATDIVVGTGELATTGKILTVHYSGSLLDGRIFDSSYSRGAPFEFTLGAGQVIEGWEQGFNGMRVGGKRRLVIPANMGYREAGVPGVIPPNSVLVFEVELLGVR